MASLGVHPRRERLLCKPGSGAERSAVHPLPGCTVIGQGCALLARRSAARRGEQAHLDRLIQMYAVEKARIEARRQGHAVLEQDGAGLTTEEADVVLSRIRLQVSERPAVIELSILES